jgi:hypothetical protein
MVSHGLELNGTPFSMNKIRVAKAEKQIMEWQQKISLNYFRKCFR